MRLLILNRAVLSEFCVWVRRPRHRPHSLTGRSHLFPLSPPPCLPAEFLAPSKAVYCCGAPIHVTDANVHGPIDPFAKPTQLHRTRNGAHASSGRSCCGDHFVGPAHPGILNEVCRGVGRSREGLCHPQVARGSAGKGSASFCFSFSSCFSLRSCFSLLFLFLPRGFELSTMHCHPPRP
jgi:hypothetical protein